MRPISHEYLLERLVYDEETGLLTWKVNKNGSRRWNSRYSGQVAGAILLTGYISVSLDGSLYLAHRLIWFMVHGEWPEKIDHKDLDKKNNRMCNLRLVSHSQNLINRHVQTNNRSGYKGVCFNNRDNRWMATLKRNGKQKYLGLFNTKEEAYTAYCKAADVNDGFFRHT
jgi:hypothetical protein